MTEQPAHPQPRHGESEDASARADDTQPVRASAETIGTLPPPDDVETQTKTSATWGHVAAGLYYVAAVAAAVALVVAWWQSIHMATFIEATHLMTWTHPRPGSLASVLLATAMMCIAAAMVAMPGILAVNTWLGRRWVRWGAIGGVVVGCAAVTLNWVAWIAMPFLVAAGAIVWLPPVRQWMDSRRPAPPEIRRYDAPITYGRIPQHY
ncbi:hypothetical protein O6R08_09460 [Cutibacterium equinum]|uniref:Uncharacterized protein n=1 Tax=Cutibacterium equinum TaxID=3016342 RepID=A0ABY7QXC1_9ACTN|nr:hypothetical protein [Cutibacterium equinum]WCC79704.1 hypothetical protein O6R08_09460 [Cutibacterium equinum]